jgi:hypothetical protein
MLSILEYNYAIKNARKSALVYCLFIFRNFNCLDMESLFLLIYHGYDEIHAQRVVESQVENPSSTCTGSGYHINSGKCSNIHVFSQCCEWS